MIDLSRELGGLCQAYQQLAIRRSGVVLQFIGAQSGVGVSTCSRAFARMMVPRMRRGLWLFDLDFYANAQHRFFASTKAQALYGAVGGATEAAPKGVSLFWRVHPELVRKDGRKAGDRFYLKMHQIGAHTLYVSRFRKDLLRDNQQVHFRPAKHFWDSMRTKADLTIIDAPALDRSRAGLVTAADADGVVIIAHPAQAGASVQKLRMQIEGRGGRCLGVIYNAAPNAAFDNARQAAQ